MKDPDLAYIGIKVPQWKTPLVISVMVHLLVVLLVFLLAPAAKKATEKPIVTRLLTPDEWLKEMPARERPRSRERPQMPSDAPPKRLYGAVNKSRQTAPKPMRQPRVTAPPAAPQNVQPSAGAPERTAAPGAASGPAVDRGPAVLGKTDIGSAKKGDASVGVPRSAGIPAPIPSMRERLFDPEVVGKIAKREEKTHDNSITFDAGEFRYEGYMNKLKEKIESIWHYPRDAASRGIQGDLKIRFTIRKDGTLDDVEVLRTSGYRDLDEAAVQALRDGSRYWPLPEDWGRDSLTITGHFVYSLYGAFIR